METAFTRSSIPALSLFVLILSSPSAFSQIRFEHHFGDRNLGGDAWGQTALIDIDGDGDLDFITGKRGGDIVWFEYQRADRWIRHLLGRDSPSDVGGLALDVNQDGSPDFVAGGAWYKNPSDPRTAEFQRNVFDKRLDHVHDIITGDIDGDKNPDVITMSDQNDLRWYKIPDDPTQEWNATIIGKAVHSGISVGDIDGDGDLDVVRSNVWYENSENGQQWTSHRMTSAWGGTSQSWEKNATQTRTVDIDKDGHLDVVIADGESRASRIAWLEAPDDLETGKWVTHLLPRNEQAARGALHSLSVGDFNGDGEPDVFTVEMESVPGDKNPRWFLWENLGSGRFKEHVILDTNLGGHEAVVGDVDGDGDLDICAKPWRAAKTNANGGRIHFDYLENLSE